MIAIEELRERYERNLKEYTNGLFSMLTLTVIANRDETRYMMKAYIEEDDYLITYSVKSHKVAYQSLLAKISEHFPEDYPSEIVSVKE